MADKAEDKKTDYIITRGAAEKIKGAPSRVYLGKLWKQQPPPAFFTEDGKIDTTHPQWISFLANRKAGNAHPGGGKLNKQSNSKKKKDPKDEAERLKQKSEEAQCQASRMVSIIENTDEADIDTEDDVDELFRLAGKAKAREQIAKAQLAEYKVQQERLAIEKDAGHLIEWDLAKFLFTGYLEKLNIETLNIFKKNEAFIVNYCAENDPKGLVSFLKREFENILIEIKKKQKHDIERWRRERDEQK